MFKLGILELVTGACVGHRQFDSRQEKEVLDAQKIREPRRRSTTCFLSLPGSWYDVVGSQQQKSAVLTSHTLCPLNNAAVIELRRGRGCQLGELHKSAPLCASSHTWLARRPGKICVHPVIPLKPNMLSRQDRCIDKATVFLPSNGCLSLGGLRTGTRTMRHSIAPRIWLPRLVIPWSLALQIRRPFSVSSSYIPRYGVRTAPAVDVSMASYRADGACLQGDDGVDLSPSLSPTDRCLAIAT
ncbi:hypothetical protein HDV63DRAFT_364200 [Trichoderma sp. SZMC 28014]